MSGRRWFRVAGILGAGILGVACTPEEPVLTGELPQLDADASEAPPASVALSEDTAIVVTPFRITEGCLEGFCRRVPRESTGRRSCVRAPWFRMDGAGATAKR